jgi:hypothetical protein
MGAAQITGGFATCPEMVSPTAVKDMRVFNEMGEQCRRPERLALLDGMLVGTPGACDQLLHVSSTYPFFAEILGRCAHRGTGNTAA